MADEFSSGVRARKQNIAVKARAVITSAGSKPEALIRYRGDDEKLNETLASVHRSLETVQGARGSKLDHGVTYRGLEAALKNEIDTIMNGGVTNLTHTTIVADTADTNATVALGDAAVAQSTADAALSAANDPHTGEVTSGAGSRALILDVSAITNRTDVVGQATDDVVIHDSSDGTIKKINLSSITDGGSF